MEIRKSLLVVIFLFLTFSTASYTGTTTQENLESTPQLSEDLVLSAHRGGNYAPENTLMAFEQAQKANMNSVEFDVRKAKGGFAVIHDSTTRRTTEFDLSVPETEVSHLTNLSAHNDYSSSVSDRYVSEEKAEEATIPSYKEVLNHFNDTDTLLRIEIKGKAQESKKMGEKLYREVEKQEMEDQAIFMSFSGTCVPRGILSGRVCNWEALEGIEKVSNGEARTAVLWQKRRDPRKDLVDAKNLNIRYVLDETEREDFDIIVARDGDNSINGLRQSFMTRKEFVEEAEERNLDYAFMGFRDSRKKQIECGVEWISTNYPASLMEKVRSYGNFDLDSDCTVENPANLTSVKKTLQKGFTGVWNHRAEILAGTVDIDEVKDKTVDWTIELVDNSISIYKRLY